MKTGVLQFLLLVLLALSSSAATHSGNLKYLYSTVSPAFQEAAAQKVLERLLPQRFSNFKLKVDPSLTNSTYHDAFEVSFDRAEQRILVVGTTGVSTLFGLNYYLKYYCNAHISWEGTQLSLPNLLPRPIKVRKNILDRFRYYQNACTESYSFVWWDWARWEVEIDWMALNGINLPLAVVGQEAIWYSVYTKLGLTPAQVTDYITGPPFLAWLRMGNLQTWGGPIPASYVKDKLILLQKIVKRMRSLGMMPVLPAFAGHVPASLLTLYPNATFERHPSWNNFNSSYSETFMLDPRHPLFQSIGKQFVTELTSAVGTNHVYSVDAYNENRPSSTDPADLQEISAATFNSMVAADSKAVWMMQAWVFIDFEFWTKDRVRSFLGGVEQGNLLVLDLQAETLPLFPAFDSFFNHAFIWCMLHNFGGTMNLYGNMELISKMLPVSRVVASNGTLVGIGLTPEGINQNYVMYDFMTEITLHSDSIQIQKWITKYSLRRYGFDSPLLENAWQTLQRGVYNNLIPGARNHGHTILNQRPRLNATEELWYDPEDISVVMAYFLTEAMTNSSSASNSSLFLHDLVDFTRQFCIHLGTILYWNLMQSYDEKDIETFWEDSVHLLQLLDDLDQLLATSPHFLLGKWIQGAESWGKNEQEVTLLRFNSLNQITTWGPNGEIVDYASKHWAGIVSDYLKPRWALFIDSLEASLLTSQPFNTSRFNDRVLKEVEIPFTQTKKLFPMESQGNCVDVALKIYVKWRKTYVDGCNRWRNRWIAKSPTTFNPHRINMTETYGTVEKLRQFIPLPTAN